MLELVLPPFPTMWEIVAVMAAILLNDFSWAFYTKRVADSLAKQGAFWATSIFISGAIATYSWIHNPWLIVVAAATTFFGTYLAIRIDNRKKKPDDKPSQISLLGERFPVHSIDPVDVPNGYMYYNDSLRELRVKTQYGFNTIKTIW